MMLDRRSFLRAALFVAAAPVIVRASSLMALPVRPLARNMTATEVLERQAAYREEFVGGFEQNIAMLRGQLVGITTLTGESTWYKITAVA